MLSLGLRLGVPIWVAPLVAPAVDLSILGLLLGIRHIALAGALTAVLRPARRLLMFASAVTLALNTVDPVVAGEYGKAAFDTVEGVLYRGGQGDLERARRADARHWAAHKRPISSDSLRRDLEIGAELARELVAVLRNEVAAKVRLRA